MLMDCRELKPNGWQRGVAARGRMRDWSRGSYIIPMHASKLVVIIVLDVLS